MADPVVRRVQVPLFDIDPIPRVRIPQVPISAQIASPSIPLQRSDLRFCSLCGKAYFDLPDHCREAGDEAHGVLEVMLS